MDGAWRRPREGGLEPNCPLHPYSLPLSLFSHYSTRRLQAHPSTLKTPHKIIISPNAPTSLTQGEKIILVCASSLNPPSHPKTPIGIAGELTWGVRSYLYISIYMYSILLRAHDLQVENAIPGVSPRGLRPLHAPCSRVHAWCALTHQAQNFQPKLFLYSDSFVFSSGEGLALRATPRP